MKIKVSVKQLGKKRPIVTQKIIEIEALPASPNLQHLIKAIVKQQVYVFNQKLEEKPIIPFLLKEDIDQNTKKGKVGFGSIYNDKKADDQAAIANALLAFQDGIYCVFIDEAQIEQLVQPILLKPDSVLTFVRLTFLAGSYW